MATSAHHTGTHDQNLNVSHNGSTPARKTNFRKADKKGGCTSRRALNDISNSRNPLIREPVKKTNFTNVFIPIDKNNPSTPGTTKLSTRVTEKKKRGVGSRKPLIDVTNSAEPCLQQHHKSTKSADECTSSSILDERFLHDHQKCIEILDQSVDKDYFLTSVGLSNAEDKHKEELSTTNELEEKNLKIEEIPEPVVDVFRRSIGCTSPGIKSPPTLWSMTNDREDDESFDLVAVLRKLE
ncbi:hypothetical protein M569_16861 [Genlisea aurea]|uniref:Uncharacterized protein n=1 Tax=Genlisea aurea TaxID=192259 RepID=S8C0K7_9LAMI|nr:hypothetical protein M569_16861 [Genlisea aurea]